jgi:hypothetical protein
MKKSEWIFLSIVAFMLVFAIEATRLMRQPGSRFCVIQIYKQPDGTHEVWMGTWKMKDGLTEEQARRFVVDHLKTPSPSGERVR